MTGIIQDSPSLVEQMFDLLERKPTNYDVTFNVGPQNVKVKGVKIILKAASPVFEKEFEIEDLWEGAMMKEGDGIDLHKMDPTIFELFIQLIISDTWSVASLNALNLSPNTLLTLLGLCRHYEITKAIKNLEEAARDFISTFHIFKDTTEFMEMSRENLETVFSCEQIPMSENEIFECACRWAERQCKQKQMELTGENFRDVLGDSLFQIRFPTMKLEDFAIVSLQKVDILPDHLKLAIYNFIGMNEADKAKFDKDQLPFQTIPRVRSSTGRTRSSNFEGNNQVSKLYKLLSGIISVLLVLFLILGMGFTS